MRLTKSRILSTLNCIVFHSRKSQLHNKEKIRRRFEASRRAKIMLSTHSLASIKLEMKLISRVRVKCMQPLAQQRCFRHKIQSIKLYCHNLNEQSSLPFLGQNKNNCNRRLCLVDNQWLKSVQNIIRRLQLYSLKLPDCC